MKPIQDLGSIVVVTLLVHVIGSAILSGVTGGPLMVVAVPLVAFFGWFMLIPEILIVILQWEIARRNSLSIVKAWLFTVLGTCVVFTCIAPKEEGNLFLWITGYAFGSLIAFSVSFGIIYRHHTAATNSAQNQNAG